MQKEIELHPVYVWDCDECGRENIVRPTPGGFSEEEQIELRDDFNIDPDAAGEFYQIPGEVCCKFCKAEFDVIPPDSFESRE